MNEEYINYVDERLKQQLTDDFLNMMIDVCSNGNHVYRGTMRQFLDDNQWDEWLIEECLKLKKRNHVVLEDFHIGRWDIVRLE